MKAIYHVRPGLKVNKGNRFYVIFGENLLRRSV